MNKDLQSLLSHIEQSDRLSDKDKASLKNLVKGVEKEMTISEFKLARTEKVKKTTAILLEETIEELEQKRKAVEAQAREAEIEAALERIRGQAMGMTSSSDLQKVMNVFYEEITRLQLSTETTDIELCLVDKEVKTMRTWSAASNFSSPEQLTSMVELTKVPVLKKQFLEWKKQPPEIRKNLDLAFECRGKAWQKMLETLSTHPDWSEGIKVMYENNIQQWHWHHAYNQYGSVVINSAEPVDPSSIPLLKRVSQVFEQTYTRFLDLQKAEAQAREAQIEAALERVRSRSLAMQKSDELVEVVATIYEQLTPLGFAPLGCELILCDEENEQLIFWSATPEQSHLPECYPIDRNIHPFFKQVWKAWKNRAPRSIITLKGAEKRKFDNLIFEKTAYKALPEKVKRFIRSGKVDVFSLVTMKYGLLESVDDKPLTEDKFPVLERFAKVFEQTYTRFLDLQKAEAQVREAEIELALERIRAKTMAMKNSTEIPAVTFELFTQMHALGFAQWGGAVALADKSKKGFDIWFSTPNNRVLPEHYFYPAYGHPIAKKYWTYFRKQKSLHILELEGEEKRNYVEWEFENTGLVNMPIEAKNDMLSEPYVMSSSAAMKYGAIQAISHEPMPLELTQILPRFAKVFEQTYTRFLDLQKAEAQAREGQIEAALERVRAASMAMHRSEDLVEVATVLHNELRSLNVREFSETSIIVHDEPNEELIVWGARTGAASLEKSVFPLLGDQILQKLYDKWLQQDDFFTLKVAGAALRKHIDFVYPKASRSALEKKAIAGMPDPTFFHCAFFCMGYLELMADKELSEDSSSLLVRFAKVFDQAYIRFLDLQKAEAQAREAQIEAALERVRARAMAMHSSQELVEVSTVVYKELKTLGFTQFLTCGFVIIDEKQKVQHAWNSQIDVDFIEYFKLPLLGDRVFKDRYKAWKQKKPIFIQELTAEEMKQHLEVAMPEATLTASEKATKRVMPDHSFFYFGNFSHGYLQLISNVKPSQDQIALLPRFAKVFEMTYGRFLDLQKAEAQAREAQIEIALERVRARALAMHSSEELNDVALELRKQMGELGQKDLEVCGIHLYEVDPDLVEAWVAMRSPDGKKVHEGMFHLPKKGVKIIEEMIGFYKSKKKSYTLVNEGEKAVEFLEMMKVHAPDRYKVISQTADKMSADELRAYWSFADFTGGSLLLVSYVSPEQESLDLLRRSASVFDLAYRRFLDLQKAEAQAEEAQIEAALEKVRSSMMAMHKSDELREVIASVFEQLQILGFAATGSALIIYDKELSAEHWMTGYSYDTYPESYRIPYNEHPYFTDMLKAWQKFVPFQEFIFEGEPKLEYADWALKHSEFKRLPSEFKKEMKSPERLVISDAFNKYGMLEILSPHSLSEEEIDVLKRFSKVFEQTYTRFLDLQKAEDQAREAQIEVALERIRARALAMHSSSELMEVANVMREQMGLLEQPELEASVIHLYDDNPNELESWFAMRPPGRKKGEIITGTARFSDSAITRESIKAHRSKETEYTLRYSGAKLKEWMNKVKVQAPVIYKAFKGDFPQQHVYHYSDFSGGALLLVSHEEPSEEAKELQKRAAAVFDLAYRRYLDLQKAETQAKEAQIEAALERVRSRSLAMHKSDELQDVIDTVYNTLMELDVNVSSVNFDIFNGSNRDFYGWISAPNSKYPRIYFPAIEFGPSKAIMDAREKGEDFVAYQSNKKEMNKWLNFAFEHTDLGKMSDERKKQITNSDGWTTSIALSKYSAMQLNRYSKELFSETDNNILKRFAKVFEQAYTRFLDLQKAEAQAREAQIEAALERIRSRSMAMHDSNELTEVIACMFEEMQKLDFVVPACSLILYQEDLSAQHWFAGFTDEIYPQSYTIPYIDTPYYTNMLEAWQKESEYEEFIMEGKAKVDYAKWLLTKSDFKNLPKAFVEGSGMKTPTPLYFADAYMKYGMIETLGNESLPSDKIQILKRISKVFEQTYTRFLDLQKAEAQAREAQIEAALERVRSRTMAMHKSDELMEAAEILSAELVNLEIPHFMSGFVLIDEAERKQDMLLGAPGQGRQPEFKLPLKGDWVLKRRYDSWKNADPISSQYVEGKKLAVHLAYVSKHFGSAEMVETARNMPDPVIFYCGNFKEGYLHILSEVYLNEEQKSILARFTKVFQQTYTRFLDLQKAEAQAREAQIEAGLERLRAQSMAMHRSDELSEVAFVLYKEFIDLGIDQFVTCGFSIYEEKERKHHTWITQSDGSLLEGFSLPLDADVVFKERYMAWKKKKPMLHQEISGQTRKHHIGLAIDESDSKRANEMAANFPDPLIFYSANFNHGYLSAISGVSLSSESQAIMVRFAKVFEQTYTRFLDLQKAEEQTREAQIEVALERVRARTMAMHQSDELMDAGTLLYNELFKLGISGLSSGFVIMVDKGKTSRYYLASDEAMSAPMSTPNTETAAQRAIAKSWRKKESFHVLQLNEEETIAHNTYIAENSKNFPWSAKELISMAPPRLVISTFNFKEGYLIHLSGEDLNPHQIDLMTRFTRVFEQTYTRFLDLQKAEAQAEEAQIEVALERIRARALAMQSSQELLEVASVMREQMRQLGESLLEASVIEFFEKSPDYFESWYSMRPPGKKGKIIDGIAQFYYKDSAIAREALKAYRSPEKEYTLLFRGKKLAQWLETFKVRAPDIYKSFGKSLPKQHVYSYADFTGGALVLVSHDQPSPKSKELLKRTSAAFDLAYKRYMDLKNAEAQAREAQIETALERIRSRSMAMHNSDELREVVATIFEQLQVLNFESIACNIIIFDKDTGDGLYYASGFSQDIYPRSYHVPFVNHAYYKSVLADWKKGMPYTVLKYSGSTKKKFDKIWFSETEFKNAPSKAKRVMKGLESLAISAAFIKYGTVQAIGAAPLSDENAKILQRFSKAFEQTYTRFLDLKKAETQAREAQIEGALERVRSAALAMHESKDLHKIVNAVLTEMQSLDISMNSALIHEYRDDTRDMYFWPATPEIMYPEIVHLPYFENQFFTSFHQARKTSASFFTDLYSKKEKNRNWRHYFKHSPVPEDRQKFLLATPAVSQSTSLFENTAITMFRYDNSPFSEDENGILKRFGQVFQQAYQRFLDLKNAEQQAKEARIESSLERVRAQAMAMHHSDDLGKTIQVYYEQLSELLDSTVVRCGAGLLNKENKIAEISTASRTPDGVIFDVKGTVDMQGHPLFDSTYAHWLKQKEHSYVLKGREIQKYYQYITGQVAVSANLGEDELHFYFPMFKEGSFYVVTENELPKEELHVFRRFSSVLSLTYRRFNDLIKAESQAREAQIEAAMERIRSRALAMRTSKELMDVMIELREQIDGLGQLDLEASVVHLYPPNEPTFESIAAVRPPGEEGEIVLAHVTFPVDATPRIEHMIDMYRSKKSEYTIEFDKKMAEEWQRVMVEHAPMIANRRVGFVKNRRLSPHSEFWNFADFSEGSLLLVTHSPASEDTKEVLRKAALVFDLAYRRYQDLMRAEARAREAEIEASLERVRAKAMAMHDTTGLGEVTATVLTELEGLGIETLRCGVVNIHENQTMTAITTSVLGKNGKQQTGGLVDLTIHPLLQGVFKSWKNKEENYSYRLQGNDLKEYYRVMDKTTTLKHPKKLRSIEQSCHAFYFPEGGMYCFVKDALSAKGMEIFTRFTKVFALAYTRFLDLKSAEERERDAVKQSSLDRVRAEIASMRTTKDLERITPLVWQELSTLGVPFFRCGIFIIREEEQMVHAYLSTPAGKSLAALHIGFDEQDIGMIQPSIENWRKQNIYTEEWDKNRFMENMGTFIKHGHIDNAEKYQAGEKPPDKLVLHLVPFKQGMLYAGNSEPLVDEHIELMKDLARAFSVAYSRYEDFVELETAKGKVEVTLTDLKSTQDQLIQSEKMASLGELTAGIAHEIQNPLNFVNNFAEVSADLVNEIKDERQKTKDDRDEELENEILTDIEQNLEKINHHGKRASSIVKGMLEHSRSGDGKKELTDINALADEYLRLAYHGLRAKDQSFNADFKLELDEGLPKINVVPQDMGRVLLNLINNAFYVVDKKAKSGKKTYQPEVVVATKLEKDHIVISVEDNGDGVPKNVIDKIFQPFFTTKVTGEGTGLGLSLSYDIVTKGHGGSLEVETKKNQGSKFIIRLPI